MNKLKTVFLDRDGVINKERSDYIKSISELEIFPNVAKNIELLKNAGFLVVVITNQSVINRGLITHETVDQIHDSIQKGSSVLFKRIQTSHVLPVSYTHLTLPTILLV